MRGSIEYLRGLVAASAAAVGFAVCKKEELKPNAACKHMSKLRELPELRARLDRLTYLHALVKRDRGTLIDETYLIEPTELSAD